jgi:hypothetical protein
VQVSFRALLRTNGTRVVQPGQRGAMKVYRNNRDIAWGVLKDRSSGSPTGFLRPSMAGTPVGVKNSDHCCDLRLRPICRRSDRRESPSLKPG